MSRGMSIFVNIGAKVGSSLNSATRQTIGQIDKIGRHARLAAAETKAAFRGMRRDMSTFSTHVSAPAALLTGMGARAALEWSKVGNELQAVSQMSDTARKKIEGAARAMPGNPTENLSAALDLARTGFDAQQIMGSLGVTIKLGKSDSSVDTAEAADIMTNVMKGMKLPDKTFAEVTQSAERTANNIAYAAAKSSTDVRLMGESFKYAAPMAARLGIEMEDLSGYFMTMADAGIKGSEAGVAFRSGLVRMIKPTKGAMGVLARYNMHLEDYVKANKKATADDVVNTLKAQGIDASGARGSIAALMANQNLSGADLIAKISDAVAAGMGNGAEAADLDKISDGVMSAMTAGVTKVDFAKFIQDGVTKGWGASEFANFFDVRQGTRLSTLWSKDAMRNINMVHAAMRLQKGQGSFLDQMYATQMKGAVAPWEKMKQGFGNLIISMAESGVMVSVANGMNAIANGMMTLSKSNPGLLKFITWAIIGLAVLAPLGFALAGLASGFSLLASGAGLVVTLLSPLVALGPMILNGLAALAPMVIEGFVAAFALLSNPIGWAVILVGVAAALIWYFWDDLKAIWNNTIVPGWNKLWTGIRDWALSVDWGSVGMKIADFLTFGLASKVNASSWGSIIKGAATGFAVGGPVGAVAGGVAGARATGGPVRSGLPYLVGERGPEIMWPGNGHIINARKTAALLAAAGASMTPTAAAARSPMAVTIHVNGAQDPVAVAVAVRQELNRLANGQAALLSD